MGKGEKRAHFVLVHGSCHGGWCWYKVATLLRAAGHRVTAPDLAACGVDARRLDEVGTFSEYARPLLEVMSALPPGERVVLVGHSYGGLVVALAADKFPEKVSAVVFLTAFMPDTTFRLSYVMEEDIALGLSLMRVGSFFLEDLMSGDLIVPLSETKYGSVKKVYIVCGQDRGIPRDFQLWMTENYAVDEVKVVEGADHMPMLSTPAELCRSLEDVAVVYAW